MGTMKQHARRSPCPINFALEIFGDKWTLLIIRDLVFFHKTGYGEFLDSPEGISTNILADRLKQLVDNGLIEKFTDQSDKKKYLYLLTEKGEALIPVLVELIRWGAEYDLQTREVIPPEINARLKADVQGFIEETRQSVRQQRDEYSEFVQTN